MNIFAGLHKVQWACLVSLIDRHFCTPGINTEALRYADSVLSGDDTLELFQRIQDQSWTEAGGSIWKVRPPFEHGPITTVTSISLPFIITLFLGLTDNVCLVNQPTPPYPGTWYVLRTTPPLKAQIPPHIEPESVIPVTAKHLVHTV